MALPAAAPAAAATAAAAATLAGLCAGGRARACAQAFAHLSCGAAAAGGAPQHAQASLPACCRGSAPACTTASGGGGSAGLAHMAQRTAPDAGFSGRRLAQQEGRGLWGPGALHPRPGSAPLNPARRRAYTGGPGPAAPACSDTIRITGARFYGYHGVLPEENAVGQPFVVDVALQCDLRAPGASDDLQQTVSYAAVFEEVRAIVEGPPFRLLEAVAHEIARALLARHGSRVHSVRASVSKVHIPKLSAAVQSVGVEVLRTREDFGMKHAGTSSS